MYKKAYDIQIQSQNQNAQIDMGDTLSVCVTAMAVDSGFFHSLSVCDIEFFGFGSYSNFNNVYTNIKRDKKTPKHARHRYMLWLHSHKKVRII